MSAIYPLYYWLYRVSRLGVLFLMAYGSLIWILLSALFAPRFPRLWKSINAVLLCFLLLAILYFTVLRRSASPTRVICLRLLAFREAARENREILRQVIMNALLFFPFGLATAQMLPAKWSGARIILVTVLLGLGLSVLIETLQYLFFCGDVEADDVLMNTIGTLTAALHIPFARLLRRAVQITKH
ncbi:MAG: VanZ family protein [Clostridia bacterium]|nr:VanZ family protein [Clostridia bacterium]